MSLIEGESWVGVTKLEQAAMNWRYWRLHTQAAEGKTGWPYCHNHLLAAERELDDEADRAISAIVSRITATDPKDR